MVLNMQKYTYICELRSYKILSHWIENIHL